MSDTDMLKIILEKVTSLDEKVTSLDEKVASLDEKVASLDEKVVSLDNRVSSLDGKVSSLDTELKSVKLTLENETNRNIKIIAEGHIDVMNKLNDVLKVENEKELMLIRLNTLENEVRKIKEIISA